MMMSLTFSGLPVCCDTARNNTCIHCITSLCYWSPWWAETNAVTKISQHHLIVLLFIYWLLINSAYLRQCVIDVFCSTSTDRSRKSSSLLLTWNKSKGRTPKVTWCVVMTTALMTRSVKRAMWKIKIKINTQCLTQILPVVKSRSQINGLLRAGSSFLCYKKLFF